MNLPTWLGHAIFASIIIITLSYGIGNGPGDVAESANSSE